MTHQYLEQEEVPMIYSNRTLALIICLCFSLLCSAQTYYYKLSSVNGSSNVSGGQFITFDGATCQETNKSGISVGNGYLRRMPQDANKYFGKSFWGDNTTFVFSSDKSSLTVNAPSGEVFKYVKSTAPQGVTTSSLIAGKSSVPSAGGGGSYTATPVSSGNGGTSRTKGQCSTCHGSGYVHENVTSQTMCQQCYGRGSCHTCGGKGWTTGMSISDRVRCSVCGQTGRCRNCNGSGKVNKTDYNKSVKCRSCNGTGRK